MDTLDLRRAFSRFATGVTVITTRTPEGRRLGVTANSFNTVSLEPPIVLWSLSARAPSLAGFRAAGRFAVHVLALDQLGLSQRFAGPAPDAAADKFDGVELHEDADGLPLLAGCSARIMCRVLSEQAVGDHVLFLGQVEHYAHTPATPLLFCNGEYQQGIGLSAAPAAPVHRTPSKGIP
jgi:flavin reductase (DIM6/NTAB) family NADH-FMN oxidoreductase RutF